jgi:hypothetical protein
MRPARVVEIDRWPDRGRHLAPRAPETPIDPAASPGHWNLIPAAASTDDLSLEFQWPPLSVGSPAKSLLRNPVEIVMGLWCKRGFSSKAGRVGWAFTKNCPASGSQWARVRANCWRRPATARAPLWRVGERKRALRSPSEGKRLDRGAPVRTDRHERRTDWATAVRTFSAAPIGLARRRSAFATPQNANPMLSQERNCHDRSTPGGEA